MSGSEVTSRKILRGERGRAGRYCGVREDEQEDNYCGVREDEQEDNYCGVREDEQEDIAG